MLFGLTANIATVHINWNYTNAWILCVQNSQEFCSATSEEKSLVIKMLNVCIFINSEFCLKGFGSDSYKMKGPRVKEYSDTTPRPTVSIFQKLKILKHPKVIIRVNFTKFAFLTTCNGNSTNNAKSKIFDNDAIKVKK